MRETVMSMVEELGNDAEMEVFGNTISIWLIDFDGWDDDWKEVMRVFERPDKIEALKKWLAANATSTNKNAYYFDGFTVKLMYSSEMEK